MEMPQEESTKKVDEIVIAGFGERFLSLFVQENWTYEQIGEYLGVGKSAIGNYAKDKVPKLKVLLKICEAKNVSLHWLVTGEGPADRKYLSDAYLFNLVTLPNHNVRLLIKENFTEQQNEFLREAASEDDWPTIEQEIVSLAQRKIDDLLFGININSGDLEFDEEEKVALLNIASSAEDTFEATIAMIVREWLFERGQLLSIEDKEILAPIYAMKEDLPQEKRHEIIGRMIERTLKIAAA